MPPRIPPLALTLLLVALMWVAARAWPQYSFAAPWLSLLAAAIAVTGLLVCLLGAKSFRRAGTTVDPRRPTGTSALVARGIYRYSRNPMYLGMLCVVAAWGLHLGHWPALACGPLAFVLYLERFQIAAEERALEEKFGAEYRAYARAVRRWL
ncbi:MAG: isoprenylcysteine carboxylmethyltransferase family protein [Steroidobacteraceae bacterium]